MAYWGEAMAYSQPLWFHEEPDKGRAALARLGADARRARRQGRPPSASSGYLRAVEALWGPGDRPHTRHGVSRMRWRRSARRIRGDDEAQVFYALALLGDDAARRRVAAAAREGRRPRRGGVRAEPAAPRGAAPDPARLRSRRAGAARPGGGARLCEDRAGGEPRPPHAGALLRAARPLARGGGERSRLVGRVGGVGDAAAALGRAARLPQPRRGCTTNSRSWAASPRRSAWPPRSTRRWPSPPPTTSIGGHHYADSEIGRGSGPGWRCATTRARCAPAT